MPSPDLRTEVLTRLGGHRDAWDHLVATQPLPTPFLRSWWVDHVAEDRLRAVSSVVEHYVDIVGVTSSNLVPPTIPRPMKING